MNNEEESFETLVNKHTENTGDLGAYFSIEEVFEVGFEEGQAYGARKDEELGKFDFMREQQKKIDQLEKLLKMACNRIDSAWHEDFLNKPEIIKILEKV